MVNKQKLNNRKTEAVISEEGSIKWFVVSIQVDRLLIWPKKNLLKGLNGGVWKTNEFLIMYEKAKMVREIRSWCGHFSGEKLWVQWKYMIITSKCICLKVIKNCFLYYWIKNCCHISCFITNCSGGLGCRVVDLWQG